MEPKSTHVGVIAVRVEIIVNASGSYMELRKAYVTTDLIKSATFKSGGAYLYTNLRGCDGQRVYFNGCSAVAVNGEIVARGKQFSLQDVVRFYLEVHWTQIQSMTVESFLSLRK